MKGEEEMTVQEFEDKVWQQDQVRVVVRAPSGQQVSEYNYTNAAQANWNLTKFLQQRIQPQIGDLEVITLESNGEEPHGRTLLSSIRNSYRR